MTDLTRRGFLIFTVAAATVAALPHRSWVQAEQFFNVMSGDTVQSEEAFQWRLDNRGAWQSAAQNGRAWMASPTSTGTLRFRVLRP